MTELTIPSGCSKIQLLWLESLMETNGLNIRHALSSGGEYHIPAIGHVDGYDVSTNTVYEFHGSFWHGDPKLFSGEDINPVSKKAFAELYQQTLLRDKAIVSLGYKLVVVWESDVDKKALNKGYSALVAKYGKKPIRVASKARLLPEPPIITTICETHRIESTIARQSEIIRRASLELQSLNRRIKELSEQVERAKCMKETEMKRLVKLKEGIANNDPICLEFFDLFYVKDTSEDAYNSRIDAASMYKKYLNWWQGQTKNRPLGRTSFYSKMDDIIGERIKSGSFKYTGIKVKK